MQDSGIKKLYGNATFESRINLFNDQGTSS